MPRRRNVALAGSSHERTGFGQHRESQLRVRCPCVVDTERYNLIRDGNSWVSGAAVVVVRIIRRKVGIKGTRSQKNRQSFSKVSSAWSRGTTSEKTSKE